MCAAHADRPRTRRRRQLFILRLKNQGASRVLCVRGAATTEPSKLKPDTIFGESRVGPHAEPINRGPDLDRRFTRLDIIIMLYYDIFFRTNNVIISVSERGSPRIRFTGIVVKTVNNNNNILHLYTRTRRNTLPFLRDGIL